MIKFAAIGFALALLMMLGLILILELMRSGKRKDAPAGGQQGAFAWVSPSAQDRPAGPPASPAMAATTASSVGARDPWRATPSSSTDGNGNGNGHANGNAQTDVPDADSRRSAAAAGYFAADSNVMPAVRRQAPR